MFRMKTSWLPGSGHRMAGCRGNRHQAGVRYRLSFPQETLTFCGNRESCINGTVQFGGPFAHAGNGPSSLAGTCTLKRIRAFFMMSHSSPLMRRVIASLQVINGDTGRLALWGGSVNQDRQLSTAGGRNPLNRRLIYSRSPIIHSIPGSAAVPGPKQFN